MHRSLKINLPMPEDGTLAGRGYLMQVIVQEILAGRLQPRSPMPATRQLAAYYGVNRKTVVGCYEELIAQGWLETQARKGSFVAARLPVSEPAVVAGVTPSGSAPALAPDPGFALYGTPLAFPEAPAPGVIRFDDGVPDTRLIPYGPLSRAFRHALIATTRQQLLGYGDPRGAEALRTALVQMLNTERGLGIDADSLCIARGSQMGIFLVARVLVRPGDAVAFERLSYGPARRAFEACGARIVPVEQDAQGLLPASLEQACRQTSIRAVYVTPHHQFPTTVMMPARRRLELLALAEQYGFMVVEDDYDHEFHYDRRPMLPMASFAHHGRVIYVGSLSKVLAPGLRVGYVAARPDIIQRCASEIMLLDRQGSTVTELAVAELIESGELRRIIWRALRVYAQRRQIMAEALAEQLAPWGDFTLPAGGLAFWWRLKPGLDAALLAHAASTRGLQLLPPSAFGLDTTPPQGFRLGFGSLDEAMLREGVRRLRGACEA